MGSWGENGFGRLLPLLAIPSFWQFGEGETVKEKERKDGAGEGEGRRKQP